MGNEGLSAIKSVTRRTDLQRPHSDLNCIRLSQKVVVLAQFFSWQITIFSLKCWILVLRKRKKTWNVVRINITCIYLYMYYLYLQFLRSYCHEFKASCSSCNSTRRSHLKLDSFIYGITLQKKPARKWGCCQDFATCIWSHVRVTSLVPNCSSSSSDVLPYPGAIQSGISVNILM